jgi:hypothetical protein
VANYLARIAGRLQEVTGLVTSTGASDAGKIIQTDSAGRLDQSLLPVGLGADTYTGTASGALSAGDFVALTSAGITRASAATTGNDADGFVLVASADAQPATIYFEGRNTALTGLTVGARYYLSDTTPGGVTTTPVTGSGKKHQYLGKAVTTTSLAFEADDAIVLA